MLLHNSNAILKDAVDRACREDGNAQKTPSQQHYCDQYRNNARRQFWFNPLVSVDLGIFTLHEGKLKILLVGRKEHPWRGMWALPGGFMDVEKDKNLEDTAKRVLESKTGVTSHYLRQWRAVGGDSRDERYWSVTVVHYALIRHVEPKSESGARWFVVDEVSNDVREAMKGMLPVVPGIVLADDLERDPCCELAFDHQMILQELVAFLRKEVAYGILPAYMLPMPTKSQLYEPDADYFTLAELLKAYEILMGTGLKVTSIRRRFGIFRSTLAEKNEEGDQEGFLEKEESEAEGQLLTKVMTVQRQGTGKPPVFYRLARVYRDGQVEKRFDTPLVGVKAGEE